MNRRNFVTGLLSVPVVGCTLIGALPPNKGVKAPKTVHNEPPTRQLLAVFQTQREADAVHRAMNSPVNIRCIGMGAAIYGYGADFIILDELVTDCTLPRERAYLEEAIRPRLKPAGRFEVYHQRGPVDFDGGSQCGISGDIAGKRAATRFRKAASELSYADRAHAKAMNILYLVESMGFRAVYDTFSAFMRIGRTILAKS